MAASFRNRLLVRIGAPDVAIQGARWQGLIQRIYGTLVHVYDPAIDWLFPDYARAVSALLDALDIQQDNLVLDLGCGTGVVTLPATQRSHFTTGIDLTAAMLHQQQKRQKTGHTSPALVQGDVRRLPVATASFDRVTTSFMLLHLTEDEKQQTFAEVRRVLMPGGHFGCLTGIHEFARVYPTVAQWRRWLTVAGLVDVQFQECFGAFQLITADKP